MCGVDWTMVLRFVEGVSPFLGALIGIWLAAHLAVSGFRKQKTIERRADWYERVHRDLVQLKSAYAMAVVPTDSVGKELESRLVKSVHEAQLAFIASSAEAALYAERGALEAVMALRTELESLSEAESKGQNTVQRVMETAHQIQVAADAVATEFRADMRMSPPPITLMQS
jgi:esterase/lipase